MSLYASSVLVRPGEAIRLYVTVAPCGDHAGEVVVLRGGGKKRSKPTDGACGASFRARVFEPSRFVAISPQQDADHLEGRSSRLRVRVS